MAKFRNAITRHMKSFNFKEPVAFAGEGGGGGGERGPLPPVKKSKYALPSPKRA